jgi:hypothetical protein
LGWPESLDHCGLGSWDLDAEDGFIENGGFGYYEMGVEHFGAVEEHGADQVEDRNIDPRELELEATVTEKESMADVQLSAWEWGQDPMELEISSETVHALTELTSSAIIPTSASATEDTNSSTDDSPALHSD